VFVSVTRKIRKTAISTQLASHCFSYATNHHKIEVQHIALSDRIQCATQCYMPRIPSKKRFPTKITHVISLLALILHKRRVPKGQQLPLIDLHEERNFTYPSIADYLSRPLLCDGLTNDTRFWCGFPTIKHVVCCCSFVLA